MGPIRRIPVLGLAALAAVLSICAATRAEECYEVHPIICTTNSESVFIALQLGQSLQFIDFETLPNGQPSVGGTQITPSFNYTSWGATFTAPVGTPTIGGFIPGTYDLHVSTTNFVHTWLRADLVHPSSGVGIYFPGATTLTAFDGDGSVIATMHYGFSGGPWFIGIVSEIPIAYVTIDRGSDSQFLNDFIFNPIPEPLTALLLLAAAIMSPRLRPRP